MIGYPIVFIIKLYRLRGMKPRRRPKEEKRDSPPFGTPIAQRPVASHGKLFILNLLESFLFVSLNREQYHFSIQAFLQLIVEILLNFSYHAAILFQKAALIKRTINMSKIMPTYFNQMPVSFEYGRGAWLWDQHGNQYLDSLSGIAVCGLGHAHPDVTRTIVEQAGKVLHTSNTFLIAKQIELAEKLTQAAGMEQAYFCNSGAEANEAAIKLARLYARKKNIAAPIIITMRNSFHGRSMATLSASGTERIQQGFEPLVKDFIYVNLNDISEFDEVAKKYHDNIIAVMLEPIQGDGGIQIASDEYLSHLRKYCDEQDLLLILDEVQTGVGRTGKWFAHQHTAIKPDIMTVAKALGNGVPIGACLVRGKACNLFGPGKHGTTFGGNPFVCAVGCAVLDTMQKDNVLNNATVIGEYLKNKLKTVLSKHPGFVEVRGKGLMIGVELDRNAMELTAIGLKHKLLFNITANKVVRLLPPLIITEAEADEIVARLDTALAEFFNKVN